MPVHGDLITVLFANGNSAANCAFTIAGGVAQYWLASGEVKNMSARIRTKHYQMAMEGTYRGRYVAIGYTVLK